MQPASGQSALYNTFDINIFGFEMKPNYITAILIVFMIFMLLMTISRMRHLYVKWSVSGWHGWVFLGFMLALVVEGFFVIGGRTVVTELLGWKNPPKPVAAVLDAGRTKAIDVLGVTDEIPETFAEKKVSVDDMIKLYGYLNDEEKRQFEKAILVK